MKLEAWNPWHKSVAGGLSRVLVLSSAVGRWLGKREAETVRLQMRLERKRKADDGAARR